MTKKGLFLLVLAILTLVVISNPLRRSEDHIKNRLMAATPWGTSIEEVESYIIDQGWSIRYVLTGNGLYYERVNPAIETGNSSIRASLGGYLGFLAEGRVRATWSFNEQSELIDISVEKYWLTM